MPKIIVTQWDEVGNEIVTECEAYLGQIDEIISGIESGLSAREAMHVYAHPQPTLDRGNKK